MLLDHFASPGDPIMLAPANRRDFLRRVAAAGAAVGLCDLSPLAGLPPVSAAELQPLPGVVPLHPDIEPLVRLLEDTPRERLLEEVAARVRGGLAYRDVLAALLLAGVRNVQPRPSVGFKFHAVLVVPSVHLAATASPETERWLPLFWALDYFKDSQARDVREGNWTMPLVDEAAVPNPDKAVAAFRAAMDNWDESAADAAVAGLARTTPAKEVFELFYRYGARDFRSIGHKAIYVAGAERTLDVIGWQHAEPVLRSLAYALLMHEGDNPGQRDAEADRPWRQHPALLQRLAAKGDGGKLDGGATRELLAVLRRESYSASAAQVVALLNRGVAAQSVWDALFCGAGELLLRQPGIVALHAVTTTNAIHYACQASGDRETRALLLLQNAAFLPLFREAMRGSRPGPRSVGGRLRAGRIGGHRSRRRSRRVGRGHPQPAGSGGQDAGLFRGGRGRRNAAERCPARDGARRRQCPRLQVRGGRLGGLCGPQPRLARTVPGGVHDAVERLGRAGQLDGGPHPCGVGLMMHGGFRSDAVFTRLTPVFSRG
jgi:hypothetical protein